MTCTRRELLKLTAGITAAGAVMRSAGAKASGAPITRALVAGNVRAARVGNEILRDGGNAVDAAVAAALAAGVAVPIGCGIGCRRKTRAKQRREFERPRRTARRAPTLLFARRSALSRRRRIRERPVTHPRSSRVAAVVPAQDAPRVHRWADRGVARCVAPPTPPRSVRRAAAARRSGDTPGHRVQTFVASTRPTDYAPAPDRFAQLVSPSAPRDAPPSETSTPRDVPSTGRGAMPRAGLDAVVQNQVHPRCPYQKLRPFQNVVTPAANTRRSIRPRRACSPLPSTTRPVPAARPW
jgi:Gamma-glutamyltranspeptidase